jgi:rhamnose transport system substrate-binding protein
VSTRKAAIAIALAVSLASLVATLSAAPSGAAHRRYTIASVEYVQATAKGGRAAAKRLGLRYIVAPDRLLHGDPPQAVVRYFKSLIARHVDAITSSGFDPAMKPTFSKVRKAGILLISSGDDIAGRRNLWVNYSPAAAFAPALADALASQINRRGEYAILVEQDQAPIADTWEKEVQAHIPKAYPGMKLDGVLDLSGAGGQAEVDAIKSFMSAHPNLKGLIGIVPTEEFAAAEAITQAGRIGQVFSAGNGGTDNMKGSPMPRYIRSGATVDVLAGDPIKLGYLTVWATHYLLTGHHFTPQAYQVGSPIGLVYYYAKHQELRLGPPLTITKKNVDQYANQF